MFNKKPIIEFGNGDVFNNPKPAKNYIPNWYKQTPLTYDSHPTSQTLKRCVPFLDGLTTGYIAELWCDILVETKPDGSKTFSWHTPELIPIEQRPMDSTMLLPTPAGHSQQRLTWLIPYFMKTPKGYSSLITHPLNRFDLPFTTMSAVVDTDGIMHTGRLPFFIDNNFEGIIKKGTPIYQIIPFKREDWLSKEDNDQLVKEGRKNHRISTLSFSGWYKKNKWVKKNYN